MILVDTSIWIDHFRSSDAALVRALELGQVVIHPFVIGEVALGNLRDRGEVIGLMSDLPLLPLMSHDVVMSFVEGRQLVASGIGWVDAHLLCAAAREDVMVWTRDRALGRAARRLALHIS